MTRVLIADDHEIVVRGMRELLESEMDDMELDTATNREVILTKLKEQDWDLVLLDILIPDLDVMDALQLIRKKSDETRVLIITAVTEAEYAVRTLSGGANGYIDKKNTTDELVLAVKKVLQGDTYLCSEAIEALAKGFQKEADQPHKLLSPRELEVFLMIANGKAVKEIAFDLSVSAKTVATYLKRIRDKTGLESHVDIARYALQNNLVQ